MKHKLAEIARSQVGVREVGGNNNGSSIRKYQAATSLKPADWPWCAAFVDWCISEWLKDKEVQAWLSLKTMTTEVWRPKIARAYGLIEWAKSRPNTTHVYTEKATPFAGDIVIYDFSHCGILTKLADGRIQVVEGNTNGRGDRESTSGDGVWLKRRLPYSVKSYIRINPSKLG